MEVKFFDAHTHVQFYAFEHDRKEVIERALKAEVGIINAGTNKKTSKDALNLAQNFQNFPIFACVGLHPLHTFNSFPDKNEIGENIELGFEEKFDFDFYEQLALEEKVVGIGECGLDYFHLGGDKEEIKNKQKESFLEQIKLAWKVQKPLVIHCRSAFDDVFDILKNNSDILLNSPGAMHFFTGGKSEAKKFIELGFYFTFGGVITFARNYDEVIKYIPLERILVETDAPYVAPTPFRGKRNEPVYVLEVLKKLSEIKKIPFEKLAETVLLNTKNLFKI